MIKQIDNIKKIRVYLLDVVKDLSTEQLNEIPSRFNNNIIWNLGHLIAAQQGVCYLRAGLQPVVEEKFISPYLPGTKPGAFKDVYEVQLIKDQLLSSLNQLEIDYQDKAFTYYKSWSTRYGVLLPGIDDAINFLTYHEGLHAGSIMALKKLVRKQ
jgi:hypothetical protein